MRNAPHSGILLLISLFAVACGPPQVTPAPDGGTPPPPVPAVTSLSPNPGAFNGSIEVTLTTDKPATIFVTTDGSDPKVEGPERKSGEGSVKLTLSQTTTLTFFSRTAEGADEAVRTAEFLRAGGPAGTISGVVVLDTVAVGQIAAATGLGGIGKTQLAVAFVHHYGQYFLAGVHWLNFADPDAVPAALRAAAA